MSLLHILEPETRHLVSQRSEAPGRAARRMDRSNETLQSYSSSAKRSSSSKSRGEDEDDDEDESSRVANTFISDMLEPRRLLGVSG